MLLGSLCGYLFGDRCLLIAKPAATIYMNLIKMIVVPTVFFAILYGITNISDTNALGRLGLKAVLVYGTATVLAVALGIIIAFYLQPGVGVTLKIAKLSQQTSSELSLATILTGIIPTNPVAAMANGNTLQIVFFAFVFGLALILAKNQAKDARLIVASVTSAVFKMVELVIKTTPYGVFAIMAWIIGEQGFNLIISLSKLALVILVAFAIQYLLFGLALAAFRLNPIKFYRKTSNIQSIAFATSSSKATITTAIEDLQHKLGVSTGVANFILPLGAAVNMTGSAIYITVCAVFFAQLAGINLSNHQLAILVLTSTIGSIGAAGYPSGAVIMLSMVLPAIGLPIDGIPLIMGIDRLLDMFRTVINVTGDCAATVIVGRLEGSLDLNQYHK